MGKTRLLAVIVAILIVVILGVLLLPGREAEPVQKEEEEPMVEIVAARAEIPAYTFITEEMVYLKEVPESTVHVNDLKTLEEAVGKRSLVTIVVDEPVMLNHIIDPNAPENRLAYNIEEGMRAASVSVDDVSGVCNQIRAGDCVDLTVVFQDLKKWNPEKPEEPKDQDEENIDPLQDKEYKMELLRAMNSDRFVSVVFLQNVRVLSLDQDQQYAPRQEDSELYYYRTVTLEVAPEDLAMLEWAQYEGKIYLALRGENDDGLIDPESYYAVKAAVREGDEFLWR